MSSGTTPLMAIGSWHAELGGSGTEAGIRVFEIDRQRPIALVRHVLPEIPVGSLTWAHERLLALEERKGEADGAIGGRLLAVDPTSDAGRDVVSETSTLGAFPCSMARHPDGSLVAVANYGSEDFVTRTSRDAPNRVDVRREYDHGSIALAQVDERGDVGAVVELVVHDTAVRADRTWQLAGHPHSVAWSHDGRFLAVADRGADTVTAYELDSRELRLRVASVVGFPRGEGPRTLVFNPSGDMLYVADELRASVAALRFDVAHGTLAWAGLASTDPPGHVVSDPDDFFALTHPSVIVLDAAGENLYVLNRGPDTIAWFDVRDGALAQSDVVPSGGSGPWGAGRLGDRLWVAHRLGGEVVEFDISGGRPERTGRTVHAPGAVSVAFSPS